MATIESTRSATGNTLAVVFTWSGLANGDDGAPIPFSMYADRSVQVFGDFGVGGTVLIEGSNDGEHWAPLTNLQGTDLQFTTPKIEMASEITLMVRPRVTGGDGTTALTVLLMAKGV